MNIRHRGVILSEAGNRALTIGIADRWEKADEWEKQTYKATSREFQKHVFEIDLKTIGKAFSGQRVDLSKIVQMFDVLQISFDKSVHLSSSALKNS